MIQQRFDHLFKANDPAKPTGMIFSSETDSLLKLGRRWVTIFARKNIRSKEYPRRSCNQSEEALDSQSIRNVLMFELKIYIFWDNKNELFKTF